MGLTRSALWLFVVVLVLQLARAQVQIDVGNLVTEKVRQLADAIRSKLPEVRPLACVLGHAPAAAAIFL